MRAAVLTIGSLFWRGSRESWRSARLVVPKARHVKVPICYGRLSRSDTYTMTFGAPAPGKALLVPCATEIESIGDLLREAEELWKAERPSAEPGMISADWGTVGAIFLGGGRQATDLAGAWAAHFKECGRPIPPVTPQGILNIPINGVLAPASDATEIVILATATRPEKALPSPEEIALKWLQQTQGAEKYFFRNVLAGIRTNDDEKIWRRISVDPRGKEFASVFPEAVSLLESA